MAVFLESVDRIENALEMMLLIPRTKRNIEIEIKTAELLYILGRQKEAEQLIDNVIIDNITNSEITDALFKVKDRFSQWSLDWRYSYRTLNTRNPNKRAKSGTYNLFGWELNYENEEDENYWGIQHSLTGSMRLPKKLTASGFLNFTDYVNSFADRANSSLKISSMQFGHLKPNPYFEWESNWQESYRDNIFSVGILQRFRTGKGATDLELSLGDIQADKSDSSSGNRYGLEVSFRPVLRSSIVTIYGFHTRFELNGATLKNEISGVGSSYQKRFSRYLGSISGRYFERDFDNIDFVWGTRRADETWNVSGEICRLMSQKASLCFNLGYEETKSSIGFYDNESPEYGVYVKGVGF